MPNINNVTVLIEYFTPCPCKHGFTLLLWLQELMSCCLSALESVHESWYRTAFKISKVSEADSRSADFCILNGGNPNIITVTYKV